MENTFENTIRELNHLISTANESAAGFKYWAGRASDPNIKTLLMKFSVQRSAYKDDLAALIVCMHGKPDEPEAAGGALHLSWAGVRSLFSDGTSQSVINTCISSEESAMKIYKDAMGADYLTDNARKLIQSQLTGVEEVLAELKETAGIHNHA